MNVSCPECQSVFRVDPVKVTGANLRARCSICGGLIPVGASVRWADEFPSSMASGAGAPWPAIASTHSTEGVRRSATVSFPAPAPAPTPPAALPLPTAVTPVPVAYAPPIVSSPPTVDTTSRDAPAAHELPSSLGTPPARDAVVRDAGAVRVPPFAPPRRPTPVTPAVAMPPLATPSAPPAALAPTLRPPTPAFVPSPALEGLGAPRDAATLGASRDAAALGAPRDAGTPREVTPMAPVSTASAAPVVPPPATRPDLPSEPRGAPTSSPAGASSTSAAAAASGTATSGGAPLARRPINPFLSNDPNQKARRLARALVSDMVAYHPQKREEGARNGTLKQLFREEIKKSYEEYVEQVGREFAESTTHFQEALNDVLAGGKRIF